MVLNFKFNILLNFISVYFVFYISFDLFLSETKIYSTKICEFFVGSSRPPYSSAICRAVLIFCLGSPVEFYCKTCFEVLRATASKYGESHDSSENSDFLLLRQKDPFGKLFSEIYFQSSSEFTFL